MSGFSVLLLIAGGVGLALTVLLIIIVLWLDWRTLANGLHGFLTIAAGFWYVGQLIGRVGASIGADPALIQVGLRLAEAGFSALCVTLYLLSVVLSGAYSRALLLVSIPGALVMAAYQLFLSYLVVQPPYVPSADGILRYDYQPIWALLYGYLALATIVVGWQRRRKIGNWGLSGGLTLLAFGILLELISPEVRQHAIGLDVGIAGALWINYIQIRLQIVRP